MFIEKELMRQYKLNEIYYVRDHLIFAQFFGNVSMM